MQGISLREISDCIKQAGRTDRARMILELAKGRETVARLVQELRSSLQDSQVLTSESEGYAQSIKRWSDAVEMKAVRLSKL